MVWEKKSVLNNFEGLIKKCIFVALFKNLKEELIVKALLDTNIIIHREASKIINQDVGILYRWLDRGGYTKCIHSLTIKEIENYQDKQIVDTFSY